MAYWVKNHQEIDNMSTASSATSTELQEPELFGDRNFYSNKGNNFALVLVFFTVSVIMFAISPGIGVLGLAFVVIYAIAALSLNYQAGVTGIVNIGVVGFFAVGAYTVSLATLLGWNWFSAVVLSIVVTAIVTALFAFSVIKLREDYFAIITITAGEIIRFFFQKEGWIVYPPSDIAYWGGTKGLSPGNAMRFDLVNTPFSTTLFAVLLILALAIKIYLPKLIKSLNTKNVRLVLNVLVGIPIVLLLYDITFGPLLTGSTPDQILKDLFDKIRGILFAIGLPADTTIHIGIPNWYMFSLQIKVVNIIDLTPIDFQNLIFLIMMTVFLVIGYLVFEKIYNSPLGRLNKAIREDDLSAETLGEDVFKRKINVLVIGNVLIAISGGFFAYFLASISPESFLPLFTFYIWAIVVLGGIANNKGAILGALIFGSSIPIFSAISLKDKIQGLFASFMSPFIPNVIGIFTNMFDPGITNFSFHFDYNLTWVLDLVINPIQTFNVVGILVPLSTIIFTILLLVAVGLKVTGPNYTEGLNTKLGKLLLNFFVGVTVILFLTNVIVTPPMTMIIILDISGLVVFTLIALAILYLLVSFNVISVKDHSEEKFDYSYNMTLIYGILGVLAIIIIYVVFIGNFTLSDRFLSFYPLIFVFLYYLIIYLSYRQNPKALSSKSMGVVNWLLNTVYLDKERVLKVLGILFLLTIIPFFFDNLAILPKVNFDKFNSAQGVTFIPLSEFFTGLSPDLARIMVVGIVIMVFILFKPDGILKERQIKTVDSIQQYTLYYNKNLNAGDSDLKIPKAEIVKDDTLLTAKALTKNFGAVVGLDKVSVTVKRGSLLGIIGPNGSGKSTFFNVLTGLLEQDKNQEGKIQFINHDVTFASISKRAQLGMGRTFQQSRLFKNLTVLENVLVSAKNQKGTKLLSSLRGNWKEQEAELHQQAFQILQYLNILHIWNNKASDISGGQQKLVALARALMSQSHIILLDEPVAGVNPTLAKKIFEKIQNLHQKEGQHYIIIEHNMDVQLNFCDYVIVFNKGQIVAEGSPDEIRNNESVLDAYLGH